MEFSAIVELAKLFGLPGLLVGVIFWLESNNRKDRLRREDALAAERKERLEADKEETESRNKLTGALEALKVVVMGRSNV